MDKQATGPPGTTAMVRPFLRLAGERGKVGPARMASSRGTPAGTLDVYPSVRNEEGAAWPDRPKQPTTPNLPAHRADLLCGALQRPCLTLSPTPRPGSPHQTLMSPRAFSPATPFLVLPLAPIRNRAPRNQAPPTSFLPKTQFDGAPYAQLSNHKAFHPPRLASCPLQAHEQAQRLPLSHFKSNHHCFHAGASACDSLCLECPISTLNSCSDVTSKAKPSDFQGKISHSLPSH